MLQYFPSKLLGVDAGVNPEGEVVEVVIVT